MKNCKDLTQHREEKLREQHRLDEEAILEKQFFLEERNERAKEIREKYETVLIFLKKNLESELTNLIKKREIKGSHPNLNRNTIGKDFDII